MRIFLPGGTGFLGTAVREHLSSRGHSVFVSGRTQSADFRIDASRMNLVSLSALLDDVSPDIIVNLAGVGLSDPSTSVALLRAVNCEWPRLLAAYVRANNGPKLIHVSSSTERTVDKDGNYESAYSASKAAGSEHVLNLQAELPANVSVVYSHNVYGPQQPNLRFVRWAIEQAIHHAPISLHYPDRIRDFVYIDDAVASITDVVEQPMMREDGDIGTAQGTSLVEVANKVYEMLGSDPRLISSTPTGELDPFRVTVANPGDLIKPPNWSIDAGIKQTIDIVRGRVS